MGGADFDQRIMDYFVKRFKFKNGDDTLDLSKNMRALSKLRKEAELAKRKLSSEKQVKIEIPAVMDGIDYKEVLTRAKFEELNKDLFKLCAAPIKTVLDDTDTRASEVDSVVCGECKQCIKILNYVGRIWGSHDYLLCSGCCGLHDRSNHR